LDGNYPINGKCIRKDDQENYGKKRDEITELKLQRNDLAGEVFCQELDLKDFTNLQKLYIAGAYLEKIENFSEQTIIYIDMPEGSYEKPG